MWKSAKNNKPTAYITGDFDGKNSDEVIVLLKNGKYKIAVFNKGFMDGSKYENWYVDDWDITDDVELWCEIPKF